VDRADARAGVHRDHDLGNERHINHDAVAEPHTQLLQRIGAATHLCVQLAVAQTPRIARLAFKYQRCLMSTLGQVHVQTVIGNVQASIGEPAVVGSVRIVERLRERRFPHELAARKLAPEAQVIIGRVLVQGIHFGTLQACTRHKLRRGRKAALFQQDRFDVFLGHGNSFHVTSVASREAYRSAKQRGQGHARAILASALARKPI